MILFLIGNNWYYLKTAFAESFQKLFSSKTFFNTSDNFFPLKWFSFKKKSFSAQRTGRSKTKSFDKLIMNEPDLLWMLKASHESFCIFILGHSELSFINWPDVQCPDGFVDNKGIVESLNTIYTLLIPPITVRAWYHVNALQNFNESLKPRKFLSIFFHRMLEEVLGFHAWRPYKSHS